MTKGTRALSGAGQAKYFRELLAADAGLTPEIQARLLETLESEVSQVRVRLPLPERGSKTAKSRPTAPNNAAAPEPLAPVAKPFDPYAFSLVVVLTKGGPQALDDMLSAIPDPAHLKAIAKAQHINVPAGETDPAALRLALIAGTEQRIADRRAAAS
jgi:chemotaxis response regulator CheB